MLQGPSFANTCNIIPTPASGGCCNGGEISVTDAFEPALVGVDAPEFRPTWIVRITVKTIRFCICPRRTTSETCEPSGPAMSDVTSRTVLPVASIPLIACSTSFSSTPAASAAPFRSRRSTYNSSWSLLRNSWGKCNQVVYNKTYDIGLIRSCLCFVHVCGHWCTCVEESIFIFIIFSIFILLNISTSPVQLHSDTRLCL